jgi:hypothetical protein
MLIRASAGFGTSGLGFAKTGFVNLLANVSANDLQIGAQFSNSRAQSLHAALREWDGGT